MPTSTNLIIYLLSRHFFESVSVTTDRTFIRSMSTYLLREVWTPRSEAIDRWGHWSGGSCRNLWTFLNPWILILNEFGRKWMFCEFWLSFYKQRWTFKEGFFIVFAILSYYLINCYSWVALHRYWESSLCIFWEWLGREVTSESVQKSYWVEFIIQSYGWCQKV